MKMATLYKRLSFFEKLLPISFRKSLRKAFNQYIKGRSATNKHPYAASDGSDMWKWADKVQRLSNINIQSIFEIGANYAQDAEFLRHYLGLKPDDIYVFEPHPQIISEVRSYYQFHAFDYAISNKNGSSVFHAIDFSKVNNSGISSLLKHNLVDNDNYFDVQVELRRMDAFMESHNIDSIDFVKLDVEGHTFEVLEGFGDRLKDVKCIQLEAEHVEIFNGERLFDDVSALLSESGFTMVYFELLDLKQSDSLWMRREFIKG